MSLICFFTLLITLSQICEGYKILIVFPYPTKSHHNLGNGFVRILLQAGHEVTYITPYPIEPRPNLHQIIVGEIKKAVPGSAINIQSIMKNEANYNNPIFLYESMLRVTNTLNDVEAYTNFINDANQRFDVVIVERMFNEVYAGFSALYDCPYIWVVPFEPEFYGLSLIDEFPNPAFTPSVQAGSILPLTFTERIKELWVQIWETSMIYLLYSSREKEVYKNMFGPALAKRGKQLPSYDEIRYNGSFVFGISHVSMGHATKLPMNYASIGGYYIEPELKPLPEDLKKFMNNSKNGVIYFSMGSNLKSKYMPLQMKKELLKMFGELPYDVVWKIEEPLSDVPKNVFTIQWTPQTSVLAHNNCVLFVTHGGCLSTTEAVHFGKPIIGIPVYFDQFTNIGRAVSKGFAKKVDLSYSLASDLKIAIEEVLSDPKYKERVKELTYIYHNRLVSPDKELLHWVDHVVQTRGALHLRSPALMVPWYQKMYLDLAALLLLCLITIFFLFRMIAKRILLIHSINKNEKKKK